MSQILTEHSAEDLFLVLKEKLKEYGISIESLAAIITDNAANMIAIHTHHLPESSYQVNCVSHTLTLSITNGLNRKKKEELPEWCNEVK